MKKTIEIECPNGYKPVYNPKTSKIEIVQESIIDKIKSYEDALEHLNCKNYSNKSIEALTKLQAIIDALNEGYKFDLIKGNIYIPFIRFYKGIDPKNNVIGHFYYKNEKFTLVSDEAYGDFHVGLGYFRSDYFVGIASADVSMLACKTREIAKYVSLQFGKLLFEACFLRYFDENEFKWID